MINLRTVGFGEAGNPEPAKRSFTIGLTMSGVGAAAYCVTALTSLMVEIEFRSLPWSCRIGKKIKEPKNHYIICGYGRAGRAVCQVLRAAAILIVVIEQLPEEFQEPGGTNWPVVVGDATEDETLHSAGIDRARGVVAALGGDAKNAYLVLSARALNPDLNIVSWATSEDAEAKILRAGADHVLSPPGVGGQEQIERFRKLER